MNLSPAIKTLFSVGESTGPPEKVNEQYRRRRGGRDRLKSSLVCTHAKMVELDSGNPDPMSYAPPLCLLSTHRAATRNSRSGFLILKTSGDIKYL